MHLNGVKEQQLLQRLIDNSAAKEYIDIELYRLKRYGCPVTVGVFKCHDPLFENKFSAHSRKSDRLLSLVDNHYFSLFYHTDIGGAIKAAENLFVYLEPEAKDDKVALTQLREDDELEGVLKRAASLFVLAKSVDETIVDDSLLM